MKAERGIVEELSQNIADSMPWKGQCIISLNNTTYLLSVRANVGESGACKLWIQGRDAIKVGDSGPIELFNQLIYKARALDSTPSVVLYERHGYQSIKVGEEIEFLRELLTEGERDWFNRDEQDWGQWIGASD